MKMTGGQAIVDSLIANGVDQVFGVPGAHLDYSFSAMYDRRNEINIIHARHEQGAAYMAYGYAQSTGKVGAFFVVPGPGLLNAGAAIATGYACNTPMLCICGQIPSNKINGKTRQLHEIRDQLEIAGKITKMAHRIDRPSDTPAAMIRAFDALSSGRIRPVEIEMAMDIMPMVEDVEKAVALKKQSPKKPDLDKIKTAAEMLKNARRPVIFAGGGTIDASPEVRALSKALGVPIVMSVNSLGVIDARDDYAMVPVAGHYLWKDADVVLGVGSRMTPQIDGWGLDDNLKIIRMDIDEEEMNRFSTPDLAIHCDAAEGIKALNREMGSCPPKWSVAEMDAVKAKVAKEVNIMAPQVAYMKVIREELPEDGHIVTDLTQVGYASRDGFPVYHPRTYLYPSYQGTLGHSYATGLGVQVANPDKKVVTVAGDGGFMFNVQEMATAVQFNIPMVCVVFNDNCYGNVKRIQQTTHKGRVIASDLKNPDFVKLGESFGVKSSRTDSPEGLRAALKEGFAHDGPVLIEVQVRLEDTPQPWHLYFRERVRGN
ncbi:MAG TPA: thiamine pyrophosphate-binding protein [Emcibacteraceae bacterium]|nr:thiamine pyrophosphate-binding protein [Emcibacteraceae bacterium]